MCTFSGLIMEYVHSMGQVTECVHSVGKFVECIQSMGQLIEYVHSVGKSLNMYIQCLTCGMYTFSGLNH